MSERKKAPKTAFKTAPKTAAESSPGSARFFAVSAPGLEALLAAEMVQLGLISAPAGNETGGVSFSGGLAELYRANLHLRTASRVLLRLGDFHAASFSELVARAARIEWERYLRPGQPVAVSASCHKSRLYHSDAVAGRVAVAIGQRLGKPSPLVRTAAEEAGQPAQLVLARLLNDHVTLSLDSSGALLHRRGYRLETAKAPLRETLAAALLLQSGWDRTSPLLDPFCGSGTIAIEAALMARHIPPGARRKFAFMDWPGFNRDLWGELLKTASGESSSNPPIIQASDRDAGAIRIAQANAERAGAAEWIEFSQRAVSAVQPPAGPGWVVTNPPYGRRVSAGKDLRDLYAQFGHVLRRSCPGWHAAVLSSDLRLLAQTGLELDTSFKMVNGGVRVYAAIGEV